MWAELSAFFLKHFLGSSPPCPPARIVLTILQRSRLAVAAAGLGLSFATPAMAGDRYHSWALSSQAASQQQQIAYLPPLPAAPRVYAMTPERRAMLNTIRYS